MKMKMVMAIVPRDGTEQILQALISSGHTATITESRGGMLRQAQQTLFIAVEERDLQTVLDIVQPDLSQAATSMPTEAAGAFGSFALKSTPAMSLVGGAVVFIWDTERYKPSSD